MRSLGKLNGQTMTSKGSLMTIYCRHFFLPDPCVTPQLRISTVPQ